MTIDPRITTIADEAIVWRRDIHARPEIMYDLDRTSALVADLLRQFGCDEVVTGLGRTGVVGLVHGRGRSANRAIGLRADMDALPIEEDTGVAYASQTPGRMHACGHDGHTAMLLGAAKHLAATRDFNGSVAFIFQPAEEGGAGAKAMIEDGLFSRFPIDEVYGMHNKPGLPIGQFATRAGAVMASTDRVEIEIEGIGGHAARPQHSIDPVVVGAQIVTALQTIVSRTLDPLASAVVSITNFHAGSAFNVIPQKATLVGTARALDGKVRDRLEARIAELSTLIAQAHGATARVTYERGYPVTCNHAEQTAFAADTAVAITGNDQVDRDLAPMMGAEDFSYMLEQRPGALIFLGNGDSAGLHHPRYDFADAAIPYGIAYWSKLVERALPL
ncbi:M20 aminoacylase family protein [Rhodopseudomonas palustris]|uniref:Hydrolase n=1 Tax=Rhodopseudomonas palustris (strain ATCC BAA-98 / CGA009) TaxID=258594 RepID=Q6N6G8_RHOPA|nr:M20 aminoacylase family protein [Rhodopseudomonas palustris]OPF90117.1 amidohydrolase [Rhodopseudomonas palustris]PPQ45637.1 amidohydrolase [Rhodopseudomonas palustris]QQM04171.1 Hippurate hydrolase [Rhodopseudomonas palustris]RJF70075.1 amidohydrolase [Rhodopseudomonas palustris]WAB75564.1 M20 family metallopeptidase [Rhodopseudomonas palustris]